ncbi:hypothetical protein A0H81_09673 [Grifola frondosa]|uniref:Uncharacterized protein n=1 Tax=Grifola frondosa TaxID=5627 RepID=A0A1C7LZM1_GRIFR|nr:hypothetical protein A0H81_09673 [Grifola frondosa]
MFSNTVRFPSAPSESSITFDTHPSAVSLPHQTTVFEICDIFYGSSPPSWDLIERFYEPSAKYENPFITATSRDVIADIHALAMQLAQVDVPRPAAVLCALFGISREHRWMDPWFKALSMWNEVTDICESESFDGHRKTIVEHTVHILILPGLHSQSSPSVPHPVASTDSMLSLSHPSSFSHQSPPSIYHNFTMNLQPPSPFHLRLPVVTRLSFNDVGGSHIIEISGISRYLCAFSASSRAFHIGNRAKRSSLIRQDLLSLIPGMTLAQWMTTRLAAQGIHAIVGVSRVLFRPRSAPGASDARDEEEALSPAVAYAKSVKRSEGPQ